jgi:hypothetical protein
LEQEFAEQVAEIMAPLLSIVCNAEESLFPALGPNALRIRGKA